MSTTSMHINVATVAMSELFFRFLAIKCFHRDGQAQWQYLQFLPDAYHLACCPDDIPTSATSLSIGYAFAPSFMVLSAAFRPSFMASKLWISAFNLLMSDPSSWSTSDSICILV